MLGERSFTQRKIRQVCAWDGGARRSSKRSEVSMAAEPGIGRAKNQKLIDARLRLDSPASAGIPMSTQDLAEGMNDYLWREHLRVVGSPEPTILDHRFVSNYEAGRSWWPSRHYRAAFRAVLQVDSDAELGFRPHRKRRVGVSTEDDPPIEPRLDKSPTTHPEWIERVRRAVEDPSRHADRVVIDTFRLQLETAKVIDGTYGAAAALSTARGVVDLIESIAPSAPEAVRNSALSLGAEAGEFIGWLFRDLAVTESARFWYDRAMEYAQMCGDKAMQGFVLLRKSQMAYESGAGHRVHMFASAAIDGSWQLHPRVRAEALLQVTRGKLMMGQPVQMKSAMEQANEVAFGYDLKLREASCWIEAGHPDRAANLYDEGLNAQGISVRDQAYFRARQAIALAHSAQPDLAAQHAVHALSASQKTGSIRTKNAVEVAHRALSPWHSRSDVAALGALLSSAR
jgi:hypothetical protein